MNPKYMAIIILFAMVFMLQNNYVNAKAPLLVPFPMPPVTAGNGTILGSGLDAPFSGTGILNEAHAPYIISQNEAKLKTRINSIPINHTKNTLVAELLAEKKTAAIPREIKLKSGSFMPETASVAPFRAETSYQHNGSRYIFIQFIGLWDINPIA
jgi:hypothetical protein